MSDKESLVQAEFFLNNGLNIKRTVRFFDEGHALTLLALRIKVLEAQRRCCLYRLSGILRGGRGWLERKLLILNSRSIDRRLCDLHERKYRLTFKQIRSAAERGTLAVEKNNRTFRPALDTEIPSLFEALTTTRGLWLFIFNPTELCADKNLVSVAAVM